MPTTLQSPWYNLQLHPESGLLDLVATDKGLPGLSGCRMRIGLQQYSRKLNIPLDSWTLASVNEPASSPSPLGALSQIQALHLIDQLGIQVSVTFALAQTQPMFLWKIKLHNLGAEPVWMEKI